jgi:hypothetical protein
MVSRVFEHYWCCDCVDPTCDAITRSCYDRDEVLNVVIIVSMMPPSPVLLDSFIFIINLDIICVCVKLLARNEF